MKTIVLFAMTGMFILSAAKFYVVLAQAAWMFLVLLIIWIGERIWMRE